VTQHYIPEEQDDRVEFSEKPSEVEGQENAGNVTIWLWVGHYRV
jgi:hypothetical protein